MDAKLPWHQRLGVRFHLLYCIWCRRYVAQIGFLRRAAKALATELPEADGSRLPAEAKERMRRRLQEALKSPPAAPE